ncbi:AAA family ATPase [Lentzea sp. JNUCC 0626]|uniref:AAA family ATPase n=1 Tax=Lentzea sp. JNUCC 0626 TaxID=3367513 RepID=UPI00374A70A2
MPGPDDLKKALAAFPKPDVTALSKLVEAERAGVFADYPLAEWPNLELDRYALGTKGDSFSRRMEFRTPYSGTIKGGSSVKHIIYRRRSDQSWYQAGSLAELPVDEAWRRLRAQFTQAFAAVEAKEFGELSRLTLLRHGQAVVTKALTTYFPEAFVPIFSASHLRDYIKLLGAEPVANGLSWDLNRQLKDLLSRHRTFSGWTNLEVARFLYSHLDPRGVTENVVKIAPGRNGEYWKECLSEGVIRVGWDEVGDLGDYATQEDLTEALLSAYPEKSAHAHKATASRLFRYFRDLPTGSRVVANQGKSKILAVGTVTDRGYEYDPSKTRYRHTLAVEWDTRYEQELDEPINSWLSTFSPVRSALWTRIRAQVTVVQEVPDDIKNVIHGLERKKQVILHGPPGTGKTRLANLVAKEFAGANVTHTTFHPSYGYEDFVEGYKPIGSASGLTLKLEDGIFLTVCEQAREKPKQNHVLVIDEINRADLSRVLGELVTYLERDKRGLKFVLPTSRRTYAVPDNVFIIGTMNTADRSVAHLDAAIRRRFEFRELRTDHDLVVGEVGALDLGKLLTELNTRVRDLLGPDFEIGHSYFLLDGKPLDNEKDVHAAFFHEIKPLLEDYTINDQRVLKEILKGTLDVDPDTSPDELLTLLAEQFKAEAAADESG